MHWDVQYLGKKWTVDGFGPDTFNCWGLVWWVYRKHFNCELPKFTISPDANAEVVRAFTFASGSAEWFELPKPLDGCLVGMSSHKLIHHVGIYLAVDGGMILHSSRGKGVLCQSLPALRAQGWNRLSFYSYAKCPAPLASSK